MAAKGWNATIFNITGVAVLIFVGGYITAGAFSNETLAPCSSRYPAGQQFALAGPTGQPLDPGQMQARLGWRQWGLLQNAKVVPVANRPGEHVLRVQLKPVEDESRAPARNGVGFFWPLNGMQTSTSACLSYLVHLPNDFKFNALGYLPGLAGDESGLDVTDRRQPASFAARVGWSGDGNVGTEVLTPDSRRTWRIGKRSKNWPRGRWVRVEQEVVLNRPGKADGSVRIWIDGELRYEAGDLMYRADAARGFAGVAGEIGYADAGKSDGVVHISPPRVQWQ